MPEEAFAVHGLSADFLSDKPVFKAIGQAFLDFIGDAKLVIHNASFDMKFLNAELDWCQKPKIPMDQAIDTLEIARKKFPGAQNSLDALCRRFGVDNTARTLHGALLDSEILADVYLELIGGRQPGLVLDAAPVKATTGFAEPAGPRLARQRATPLAARLTDEERDAHAEFVKTLGDAPMWTR